MDTKRSFLTTLLRQQTVPGKIALGLHVVTSRPTLIGNTPLSSASGPLLISYRNTKTSSIPLPAVCNPIPQLHVLAYKYETHRMTLTTSVHSNGAER
jgi:hypothetical protein